MRLLSVPAKQRQAFTPAPKRARRSGRNLKHSRFNTDQDRIEELIARKLPRGLGEEERRQIVRQINALAQILIAAYRKQQ